MKLDVTHDERNFPHVSWVEKHAFGSLRRYNMFRTFLLFIAIGAALGWYLCWYKETEVKFITALGGAFIAAIFYIIVILQEAGQGRFSTPSKPRFRDSPASATIVESSEGLEFFWEREGKQYAAPLREITAFEFGNYEEWFGEPANAGEYYKYLIIVIHTLSGIHQIAVHSGPKADIAHLHAVLTNEFITQRNAFMKPAAPKPRIAVMASVRSQTQPVRSTAGKPQKL